MSNRLLGVSVKTPPTLTKSRRPKGGKVLTMTPSKRCIVKKSDGVPTSGVKHTHDLTIIIVIGYVPLQCFP